MKRICLLIMISLFTSLRVVAQNDMPYHVIDSTMVFSEDDFRIEPFHLGYGVSVLHNNYPEDESFGFMESAKLMCWMPKFNLQTDERIASAEDVSCEFEDEVLFLDDPQIFTGTKTPLSKDFPSQPFYAYKESVRGGLLSDWEARSGETDYLFPIRTIMVKVSPFRYDSEAKKLYLNKRVRIKIRLAERPMNKYVQEGTVRDQDGNPIPNALLTLADTLQYHTDADGHYKITIETWSSDTSGKLWVTADNYTASKSYVVAQFPISVINLSETIDFQLYNALNFKAGQLCTIILPVEPDATMGRYFRLDRVEDGNIVFERVFSPKAYYPYILIPDKDARLELAGMDLRRDTTVWVTTNNNEAGFYGAFYSSGYAFPRSFKYYPLEASSTYAGYVEAMHATLYYPYMENWGLILHDPDSDVDAIYDLRGNQIVNRKSENSTCYDLSGRRVSVPSVLPRGVYIRDGKKFVVR